MKAINNKTRSPVCRWSIYNLVIGNERRHLVTARDSFCVEPVPFSIKKETWAEVERNAGEHKIPSIRI